MRRVKFYSLRDLSIKYNLVNAEIVLKNFDESIAATINDIIEYYNILEFFKQKLYHPDWDSETIDRYILKTKKMKAIIGSFFSKLTYSEMLECYNVIDVEYYDDFWRIFSCYKLHINVSDECFTALLRHKSSQLSYVLARQDIVKRYGKALSEYMMQQPLSAEDILDKIERFDGGNDKAIYIPQELTNDYISIIIDKYIMSEKPNLNYLSLIELSSAMDPKNRLNARKRKQVITEAYMNEKRGSSYSVGIECQFVSGQMKLIKVESEGTTRHKYTYSKDWVIENSDYLMLLNNYIHMFGFVDRQIRIQHVNKFCEMGVVERYTRVESRRTYIKGIVFEIKDILAVCQTQCYISLLSDLHIDIEDILSWFFSTYLRTEFYVVGFIMHRTNKESSSTEKCRHLLPEMESILKQFQCFVNDGRIDHEFIAISSRPMSISEVGSLVPKKYIYMQSDELTGKAHFFFSDQSVAGYIPRFGDKYNNLYDALANEQVLMSDFEEYNQNNIQSFIDQGYLERNLDGIIRIKRQMHLEILKDLYMNEVISYHHYPHDYLSIIDGYLREGHFRSESTLFSIPEQNYINYILNKSEYTNGLDLRNSYLHGTRHAAESEDYIRVLNIMILYALKIHDELCLAEII